MIWGILIGVVVVAAIICCVFPNAVGEIVLGIGEFMIEIIGALLD